MMQNLKIDGVVPIIPTPFSREGTLDWMSLTSLLEFAVDAGVSAVCLPAYASEFYKMADDERRDVADEAIRIMAGRLPVICQVNHTSVDYVSRAGGGFEKGGGGFLFL